jgi:hypothetical protein
MQNCLIAARRAAAVSALTAFCLEAGALSKGPWVCASIVIVIILRRLHESNAGDMKITP